MKNTIIFLGLIGLFFVSCKQKKELKVDEIIEETLKNSGTEFLQDVTVAFDFDQNKMEVYKKYGEFKYSRAFQDTLGNTIIDEVNNQGFVRLMNGEPLHLPENLTEKYKKKLYYFVFQGLVPYRLQQPMKTKELLGTEEVKFEKYYKIKATYENTYPAEVVYWINVDDYTIDYIGFMDMDAKTPILRVAIDEEKISGIWFSDFIRYYSDKPVSIDSLGQLYSNQELKEGKLIEVSNISIKSNPI
ncbi:DUF6503 family protein [Aureivirga marina]|uniref:DUF6503 family protein n=1 Tax=Aureivirga marina TaxID=1182451 RepID=UPI0018CBB1EA|nr:DUF6503 family protein [Aureivirga marina]